MLYLAYGSNLCFETFQGRRGIQPLAAVNVVVPELKLTFDLPGVPYTEPCFANTARRDTEDALNPDLEDTAESASSKWSLVHDLEAAVPETVHLTTAQAAESMPLIGVVYEVTAKDYAHIIETEGPTYADVLVTCTILPTHSDDSSLQDIPSDKPFRAHTLLAGSSAIRHSPTGKPAQPSLRYLTLCRNGAAEHDLPPHWQSYLGNLKHYEMTTMRQRIGRTVFMAIFTPIFIIVFGLRTRFGKDRKISKWLASLMGFLFKAIWLTYDWFLRPVFGDGERTEEKKNGAERIKV